MTTRFNFEERREQSAIKTEIVTKYFDAWATIMATRSAKLGYIDLYAGPGIYEDGSVSTPIIIVRKAIENKDLRNKMVFILNDRDNASKLSQSLEQEPGVDKLKFKPRITNKEINYHTPDEFDFDKIPCFCFIDPAGYNGLSLKLLEVFGRDYGTDIIMFFNYNDINRALSNPLVEDNMRQLFGEKHFKSVQNKILGQTGQDRESIIVNEMTEAMHDIGLMYTLPFRFKFEGKNRTSHYIIFASKNITGFNVMKDIMYKIGEKDFEGIGKYEFIPSCDKEKGIQLSIIDLFSSDMIEFKQALHQRYRGKTISVKDLYDLDSPYTRFVKRQYKEVLKELEADGKVICDKSADMRRKNTLADTIKVTFI